METNIVGGLINQQLSNAFSSFCLGFTTDSKIRMNVCNKENKQKWFINKNQEIKNNLNESLCLETNFDNKVFLNKCNNGNNFQKWLFSSVTKKWEDFKITNQKSYFNITEEKHRYS